MGTVQTIDPPDATSVKPATAATTPSATGGWWARGPGPTVPDAAVASRPLPAPAASAQSAFEPPLIAVARDGRVTMRVEQQPLERVLEQVAAQTGSRPVLALAPPGATAAAPASDGPDAAPSPCAASTPLPIDTNRVQRAIEDGSEPERLRALSLARAHRLPVDPGTLKSRVEGAWCPSPCGWPRSRPVSTLSTKTLPRCGPSWRRR
jgi:hypothetical protein